MVKFRPRDLLIPVLVIVTAIWGAQIFDSVDVYAQDVYGRIGHAADSRYAVETAIRRFYVEDVDVEELEKAQIDGMLDNLDVYSGFLEKRQQQELRHTTHGEFGGLGIHIQNVDHHPTVIAPVEGTPAWEAGLQTGDAIVEIEGESSYDMHINDVVDKLRGRPGTRVTITVKRPGVSDSISFTITRAIIQIKAVRFAGRIYEPDDPSTTPQNTPDWLREGRDIGYVRVTTFSRNVTEETRDAIAELLDLGIKGFILDLRFNPGGLLEEARAMSDLFLPKGTLIVSTKGRAVMPHRYHADEPAFLPEDIPMVVLIDRGSASASEIVAGAIQDSDRGVILGVPSWGKGSVQTVYDSYQGAKYQLSFSGGVGLKLTTAYYYTPSGRCIHKQRMRDGDREIITSNSLADTSAVYNTLKGRQVRSSGGITPDVVIKPDRYPLFFSYLRSRRLMFEWGVEWASNHEDTAPHQLEVTDKMIREFRAYVDDTARAFEYDMPGEAELGKFEERIKKANYDSEVHTQLERLRSLVTEQRAGAFERSISAIRPQLRSHIAGRLWGRGAFARSQFLKDEQLEEAINILTEPQRYDSQLAQSPVTASDSINEESDDPH